MPNQVSEIPATEKLAECVSYCPMSGRMYWRQRPRHHFQKEWPMVNWNNRYAGSQLSAMNKDGYLKGAIDKKSYGVHRLAWTLVNGQIPDGMQIDHINGNRSDNSLSNLRLVTYRQNSTNRGLSVRNKTGFTGVHYRKSRDKYAAMIGINGVIKHIGHYDSIEDAVAARMEAQKKHFGEYARQTQHQ